MAYLNKVQLIGNVGRDPELRYLNSGAAVVNLSLATTTKRKDKTTGETIEDTQWHRVTFYERLAEIVGEFVKKGSSIYIEGRLSYGKYTDKDGVEKNTTDIIGNEMKFLGDRSREQQDNQDNGQPKQPQRPHSQAAPQRQAQRPASGFDDMEDDIPF